jgi:voltage-gated potassium channel
VDGHATDDNGQRLLPEDTRGLLCLLLATYGFAVFGYVTATVASFFVARDADTDDGEIAGARQLDALRQEIAALRDAVEGVSSTSVQRSAD